MIEPYFKFFPIDWQAVAAVANILQAALAAVLLISLLYAYRTIKETQSARHANLLIWAIEQMEQIKEDITTVQNADRNFRSWTDKEQTAAQRVSVRLQRMGYMARCGLIEKRHFRTMWALTFIDMWEKLSEWVKEKRRSNSETAEVADGAYSRADFELLAEEFRSRHHSG
jgi:hypothetical protein